MRISRTSVFVADQEAALAFSTNMLGFVLKHDVPLGGFRWLTVVSPEEPDGAELVLEPNVHPAVRAYQSALYAEGVPLVGFAVDDVAAEHARLSALGVRFSMPPTVLPGVTIAVLDDGCGNLVQMYEMRSSRLLAA